ncbi:MAG: hypothetical protein DRP51_06090 [Candidatus Zixiibacteriota bacterium]|nr:MAG: hypothetical protein DRP51_06090 [candidate division Zixibacteria bacterium]
MAKMTKEERAARKLKRDTAAEAKRIKGCLAADRRRVSEKNIPTPCIVYDIGERVTYGAWDWTSILQVCEGGLYYKLVSVTRNTGRNISDSSKLQIHYLPWYNITPYQEDPGDISILKRHDDIHFNFQQRDIISLLNIYFDRYGVDLEPEYQRGNVWTPEQKESLIDSIFKNVDIGKIAIIKRPWGPDGNVPLTPKLYEMLDGKQRLTALIEFFTGRFSYKGKYYNDLHPSDKNHFKYYSLSYAETNNLTKEQKYRYFLKLNTTGTPVDPAHMERVAGMLQEEIEK